MSSSPKRVLIVEDESYIAEMYAVKLREAGYEVEIVTDGREAVETLLKEDFDAIILDILLPYLRGNEALKKVIEIKPDIARKTLVMSNYDDPETKKEALSLGVKDYILKTDLTPSDVLKKVEEIVNSENNS